MIAEPSLHLAEQRREHRADGGAGGVDKVHDDDLVSDDVADKFDLPAVLVDQRLVQQVHLGGLGRLGRLVEHGLVVGVRVGLALDDGLVLVVLMIGLAGGDAHRRQPGGKEQRHQLQR